MHYMGSTSQLKKSNLFLPTTLEATDSLLMLVYALTTFNDVAAKRYLHTTIRLLHVHFCEHKQSKLYIILLFSSIYHTLLLTKPCVH